MTILFNYLGKNKQDKAFLFDIISYHFSCKKYRFDQLHKVQQEELLGVFMRAMDDVSVSEFSNHPRYNEIPLAFSKYLISQQEDDKEDFINLMKMIVSDYYCGALDQYMQENYRDPLENGQTEEEERYEEYNKSRMCKSEMRGGL